MTTTKTETKQKPAFYIFVTNENGETLRVGAAFHHAKGKGMNILIDNSRFVAFPPKSNPAPESGA